MMERKPPKRQRIVKFGSMHILGPKHVEIPRVKIRRQVLLKLGFIGLKKLRLKIEKIYKAKHPEDRTTSKIDPFFIVVRKGEKLFKVYWIDVTRAVNFTGRDFGIWIPRETKPEK
ncbi:MAG: hypothetical protein Q7K42_00655 [Candidatus Diapherotrites archaeon]|nr:hypothetical protein [Candidatus Diapherotrites archaeon]